MTITGTVKQKVTHFTGMEKYRIGLQGSQGCSVVCVIRSEQTLTLIQISSYLPSSIHIICNTVLITVFYSDLYTQMWFISEEEKKNQNKNLQASKLILKTILSFKYINYKYSLMFFLLWVTSHKYYWVSRSNWKTTRLIDGRPCLFFFFPDMLFTQRPLGN